MAVVVAVAAVAGALVEWGPSPWIGGALVVVSLLLHRPVALAAAVFLLAGGLATRAEDGLVPVTPGPFSGAMTLLSDPEPTSGGGVRADVHLDDGRHVEAVARAASVDAFRPRAAGERLSVVGRLRRAPPGSDWLRVRHDVGELDVDRITTWSPGGWPARAANAVRTTLQRGSSVLPTSQRPLFLGFVLGDTRGQPPEATDDFRGAGLTHLLAVSGENVAFVLALAGPVLRRMSMRPRFVATLAVIGFFALVTRFEPSVLRASMMAALAVTATTLGREASRLRVLALAVAALVLLDPFLVRTVGFQLSVAASAGIVLLAPPLARRLRGPRVVADAFAVTIAAQAGVAPLLVATFGGVPVASVPANVIAAPAAAAVMVWGVGAGLPAGLLGPSAARVLHWPTGLLIGWLASVAHRAAALPLGELQSRGLLAVGAGVALVVAARRLGGWRPVQWSGTVLAAAAVVAPALALGSVPDGPVTVGSGAVLWRAGGRTLLELDGRADVAGLLEALRRTGARRLDVVVVRTTTTSAASTVESLRRWGSVGSVLTPAGVDVSGARVVTDAVQMRAGPLSIEVAPDDDRLFVDVARGPPV
jgi:competence protein ComEC